MKKSIIFCVVLLAILKISLYIDDLSKKCEDDSPKECEHQWTEATCTEAQKCTICGEEGEEALGHDWIAATDSTPEHCSRCDAMNPMAEPESGTVLYGEDNIVGDTSSLSIHNSADTSCFVKLKDENLNDVFTFYVRAGENISVKVPSAKLYVYFAEGKNWYGEEYLFGNSTRYSKDDQLLDFASYMYSFTLYNVEYGNFSATSIDESDF